MISSNYTLNDLLVIARDRDDDLTKRIVEFLVPLADSYSRTIATPDDIIDVCDEYVQKVEMYEVQLNEDLRELADTIEQRDDEIEKLNRAIGVLRYDLETNNQIKKIGILKEQVMDLMDKLYVANEEKGKLSSSYLELFNKHGKLEEKYNTWTAVAKEY